MNIKQAVSDYLIQRDGYVSGSPANSIAVDDFLDWASKNENNQQEDQYINAYEGVVNPDVLPDVLEAVRELLHKKKISARFSPVTETKDWEMAVREGYKAECRLKEVFAKLEDSK